MRLRRGHRDRVPVITDARPSQREEFDYRRRRYTVTMLIRVACLVLAAVFYRVPWLAVLCAALAVVLPWIAVIMANDRLPAANGRRHTHHGTAAGRGLPAPRDSGGTGNGGTGNGGGSGDGRSGGRGRVIDQ